MNVPALIPFRIQFDDLCAVYRHIALDGSASREDPADESHSLRCFHLRQKMSLYMHETGRAAILPPEKLMLDDTFFQPLQPDKPGQFFKSLQDIEAAIIQSQF